MDSVPAARRAAFSHCAVPTSKERTVPLDKVISISRNGSKTRFRELLGRQGSIESTGSGTMREMCNLGLSRLLFVWACTCVCAYESACQGRSERSLHCASSMYLLEIVTSTLHLKLVT